MDWLFVVTDRQSFSILDILQPVVISHRVDYNLMLEACETGKSVQEACQNRAVSEAGTMAGLLG